MPRSLRRRRATVVREAAALAAVAGSAVSHLAKSDIRKQQEYDVCLCLGRSIGSKWLKSVQRRSRWSAEEKAAII
jgi:hypothetical protein